MLATILKVDFNETSGIWAIQLKFSDGKRAQAQFTHDAFKNVRSCQMGQFLLHAWFGRAQATAAEAAEKVEKSVP